MAKDLVFIGDTIPLTRAGHECQEVKITGITPSILAFDGGKFVGGMNGSAKIKFRPYIPGENRDCGDGFGKEDMILLDNFEEFWGVKTETHYDNPGRIRLQKLVGKHYALILDWERRRER